ncbi:MAG: peptidoglycan DD-metalloendopeptidase family protein [Bacillota bacterium]
MLEPALVRRILTGVLLACLVAGAGVLGWMQSAAGRRAREVDRPAAGGVLVQSEAGQEPEPRPPAPVERAGEQGAMQRPLQAAAVRQVPTPAPPARGGRRSDPVHEVRQGETLYRIARTYGVTVTAVQQANGLATDLIRPGQLLVLPGRGAGSALAAGGTFIWPVGAPVSSYFGPRWGRQHKGIDLAANHGDQIRASRDGQVVTAGVVPGYGETVILAHSDGSRTLYAHCSRLLVKPGERVKQGEAIALVGSTGHSTGPHLHFEIIVNGQPADPLLYLPRR